MISVAKSAGADPENRIVAGNPYRVAPHDHPLAEVRARRCLVDRLDLVDCVGDSSSGLRARQDHRADAERDRGACERLDGPPSWREHDHEENRYDEERDVSAAALQ